MKAILTSDQMFDIKFSRSICIKYAVMHELINDRGKIDIYKPVFRTGKNILKRRLSVFFGKNISNENN